jgi:O-antigen ligase
MPPQIAAAICTVGILGLYWLDRDPDSRTSLALWIPLLWVSLACSRPAATWLGLAPPDSAEQIMEGSPFDRLVYLGLLIAGMIVLVSRSHRVVTILKNNAAILFFFFYCALSVVWADYPGISFKRWTKALGDLVIILIVFSDKEPLSAVKKFLSRPAFLLIPLSMLFIKYYPALGTAYGPWGGPRMNTGVTTDKNTLGSICLCFGLGALWRFLSAHADREAKNRTRQLTAQGVILIMVLWLLWTANSVTSLSCFLMGSLMILATRLPFVQRRPAAVHILIAAMLSFSVAVLFFGVSPSTLASMGRNPTLTDRTEVWGRLFRLVRNPLIGTGFENFWLGSRLDTLWGMYWWHPNEAHNGYIEIYLNLGWIGISLLAVVLIKVYRAAIRSYRANAPLGSLCLGYFLVGLAFNFTEAAFFKMLAPVWIFLLFAMVGATAIPGVKIEPSDQDVLIRPDMVTINRGRQPLRRGVA